MIILDTNVLSALMRTAPAPPVVVWLDRQPAESVWITSITLFEVRLGLALLPQGRRRRALEAAFTRLLEDDLEHRVLDFDAAAAQVKRAQANPNGLLRVMASPTFSRLSSRRASRF